MPSRQRTQFTDDQTQVLEETFRSCYYPNTETKKALAEKLGLVENRITVRIQLVKNKNNFKLSGLVPESKSKATKTFEERI